MSNTKKHPTFHLGITMAGAVSAGAYTAGFIDYLIEILEIWETQKTAIRAKIANNTALSEAEKKIPLHDVCIEVLGGASAGGMVGMIAALSTFSKMPPVKTPTNTKTGNILYDSWVLLDDDDKAKTFEKMLTIEDITSSKDGTPSALNSTPIDNIADRVFNNLVPKEQKRERPNYISEDLRIIVTLCSLRGVPFELKFQHISSANFPYSPGHRMNEHMVVAHFKMSYNDVTDKDVFLNFDPYDKDAQELLKLCTKATGAFPVGLAPRHFKSKITKTYLKNCILRNLDIDDAQKSVIDIKIDDNYFNFTAIDGGTINNEPYSEVVQVLETLNIDYNPKLPMFGTIMVDPFPNFYNQDEAKPVEDLFGNTLFQKNFLSTIPKLYTTFREQVRVKHSGSFYKDYLRLLVFPVKWQHRGVLRNHPPLACAALAGFGGFLNIEFRKHDFFLGRNNARNFLRSIFMLEYNPDNLHPLFQDLDEAAVNTFKRKIEKGDQEKLYMPIIPDLNLIEDKENNQTNPFHYTVDEFPKLEASYLKSIEPQLKKRIKIILTNEINSRFTNKWALRTILKLSKGYATRRLTKSIISTMTKDFTNRNMV